MSAGRAARVAAGHPGVLLAAGLVGAWALAYPHTADLAAQAYRLFLFQHYGWQVWDGGWYGGHHLLGYSLLYGPVAGLLGIRLAAAIAVVASVVLFDALSARTLGAGARAAVLLFAVAAAGDAWIGRVTFALGVTFGLGAALGLARGRPLLAAPLSALCAAASPVTGLFLALAGAAYALGTRRAARGLALGGPALAVAVLLALLFPEGGREPFPATTFAATVAAALALVALVPARERVLRAGAWLYLAAVVASELVSSPMGANVGRLGVLLGAPLLGGLALHDRRRTWAMTGAVAALLLWTVWGPVREVAKVSGDPSTRSAYYQPLMAFLLKDGRLGPARLEVPFTRGHWEADYLAQRFALARGWERQLDTRFDGSSVSPAAYLTWLRALAVRYVAVPDVALDGSSRGEAAVIRARPAFLAPVWAGAHWRVYAVLGAAPAARGYGRMVALRHEGFDLAASGRGPVDVQVRWSRYFTVTRGRACVARGPGGWTRVLATAAGPVSVQARFSLGRALGGGGGCATR
jgi:hypothetical protein